MCIWINWRLLLIVSPEGQAKLQELSIYSLISWITNYLNSIELPKTMDISKRIEVLFLSPYGNTYWHYTIAKGNCGPVLMFLVEFVLVWLVDIY